MTNHSAKRRQIEQAITTIESKYKIGKLILEQCGPQSLRGEIVRLAEKYKLNRDMAQKLRAMAMRGTGYTNKELDGWYCRFRKAEFALTISHFIKLVSVPKGRVRDDLTRQAIKNRWSSHRLQSEIVKRLGRRQTGGRKPVVVIGEHFEDELSRTLWSWNRRLKSHLEAIEAIRKTNLSAQAAHLPVSDELVKEMKSLQKKINKLHDSLT